MHIIFKNIQAYKTTAVQRHTLFNILHKGFSIKPLRFKGAVPVYLQDGSFLHKPGENSKAENYVVTEHTERLLKDHLQQTGGQVRTRFAPEPNGLLHIGHAKAININFGYAQSKDGICLIRFDDTNPETEDEEFAEGITEKVKWLGFQPYEVTYASDYFQQLYDWAEKLIKKDLAYVCYQPPGTDNAELSPWRNRPTQNSLDEFKAMKNGHYCEGEATLRLKMTSDVLGNSIDPVAYRIKSAPHYRTKSDWWIYPTYDYAHGLCDSIQNITHSFCTTEFTLRRSIYYWICNALQVYCPVQIEYGRLNLLYTVVSKRKINALIEARVVQGWDDPRLYTLGALERRGFPTEAINAFSRNFGIRKESAFIDPIELHEAVREHLQTTATRIMAVLNPLKVVIINFPDEGAWQIQAPNIKDDPSAGSHTVTFDREIWIEKSDFKEIADKGFRRLTLTQSVGLKHTSRVMTLKDVIRDSCGEVECLNVELTPLKEAPKKPKAFIHWVAKPIEAEVRLYENLFNSRRPDNLEDVPGGFLSDVNPNSMTTLKKVLVGDSSLSPFQPRQRFQFERIGYFCVDSDSQKDQLVFNRIVELKQEKGF